MNRELIIQTLFERLTSPPFVFPFTANLSAGDTALTSVSDTNGLVAGMPLSGRGLQVGTVLASVDPPTLSKAPTISGVDVPLTQGLAEATRVLKPAGEMTNMPAMCLVEGTEVYPNRASGNPRAAAHEPQFVTLQPYLWLYAQAKDPAAVPNSIINVLLDSIDTAITPTDGRFLQNLGLTGIDHCRIEGSVLRSPGVDGIVSARVQFAIQVLAPVETRPL